MDARPTLSSNGTQQITKLHFWINIWIQNPYDPLTPSLHNTQNNDALGPAMQTATNKI